MMRESQGKIPLLDKLADGGRMADGGYLTKDDFRREMGRYPTKEYLAQMEARLVKWMVGLMFAAAGIAAAVAVVAQRLA